MKCSWLLATAVYSAVAVFSTNAIAKDKWMSVRSENFFLIGNASEHDIRQTATKLEQFREMFSRLLPKLKLNSGVPITVIVFKSDAAYKPFKPLYQVIATFRKPTHADSSFDGDLLSLIFAAE